MEAVPCFFAFKTESEGELISIVVLLVPYECKFTGKDVLLTVILSPVIEILGHLVVVRVYQI